MKTIKIAFIGLLMMGLGAGVVNAQAKTGADKTKSRKTATAKSTDTKTAPASSQHLKKDGTPDKRYKENKTATPAKDTKATKTKTAPATK